MDLLRKLSLGIAGSTLALVLSTATVAAETNVSTTNVSTNGANGLVAAVVSATDTVDVTDSNIDVAVVELNDSLNNLQALNNVLNHSPILSGNDVDVNVQDVSVLSDNDVDVLNDALNQNNISLDDVVGVSVLSGGDFVVFTQSQ